MEPPEAMKTIGRPKVKRNSKADEARKRKGEWNRSPKGSIMHCKRKDATSIPSVLHSCGIKEEAKVEFQIEMGTQQSQLSVYSTTQPYGPEVGTEEDQSLANGCF